MTAPITFVRLPTVAPADLIALMNHPDVRRHLPLARGAFDDVVCARFVAAKERIWAERGWGPWGFRRAGEFIGWGGLQPEGDDIDVGMILHPRHWGVGLGLYRRFIAQAFGELQAPSVIALLPPSRTRVSAMRRLGFAVDGDVMVGQEPFVRYRLHRPRDRS